MYVRVRCVAVTQTSKPLQASHATFAFRVGTSCCYRRAVRYVNPAEAAAPDVLLRGPGCRLPASQPVPALPVNVQGERNEADVVVFLPVNGSSVSGALFRVFCVAVSGPVCNDCNATVAPYPVLIQVLEGTYAVGVGVGVGVGVAVAHLVKMYGGALPDKPA